MKTAMLLIALSFTLTACHTFHLNNGANVQPNYESDNFHHIGVLSLVEFSNPVDLRKQCDGGWDSVQTRTGPIQVLVAVAVGGIYNPEEVQVSCKK